MFMYVTHNNKFPTCCICHNMSIAVAALICPSSQHIHTKWTLIRVCSWWHMDRWPMSRLFCNNMRANGVIDIQHVCPILGSDSTVSWQSTCPRFACDCAWQCLQSLLALYTSHNQFARLQLLKTTLYQLGEVVQYTQAQVDLYVEVDSIKWWNVLLL